MKIEGLVYRIGTKEVKSEKFAKQDVILEVDEGPYKQHLSIQFVNDKCALLQNLAVGNKVGIEINIKGRLWTNASGVETCFNTLEGWKLDVLDLNNAVTNVPIQNTIDESNLPF
jgi:hypothetical protein